MLEHVINFFNSFFVQKYLNVIDRKLLELEPAVLCAFFEIMGTKFHHNSAVASDSGIPNGPYIFGQ